MTSDDPPPPKEFSSENQQRQAPTIELTATEIPSSTDANDRKREADAVAGEAESSEEQSAQAQPHSPADGGEADARMPPPKRDHWLLPTGLAALAGVAAAACCSLLLAYANPFASRNTDLSLEANAINARLTRLEATAGRGSSASSDLNQKNFDDLAGRLAKLETAAAAPQPNPDTAASNRLSTIEGELRALSESMGVLRRRDDEIGTATREAAQRADAATASIADLRQKMSPSVQEDSRKMQDDLQNALSRLAGMEGSQKKLESELAKHPETRDQAARLALAMTALNAAVESGQPFVSELAAVKSLSVNTALLGPLEPFAQTGIPAAGALSRELTALTPQLLASGGAAARESTFLGKLQANAEKLVRIRPLDEAQGSDTAAVVTRADNRASKGNLSGAIAELETLPPDMRAPAAPWISKAQARLAAIEASRRLAADAMAGLSK
jgi:hypothetical protein